MHLKFNLINVLGTEILKAVNIKRNEMHHKCRWKQIHYFSSSNNWKAVHNTRYCDPKRRGIKRNVYLRSRRSMLLHTFIISKTSDRLMYYYCILKATNITLKRNGRREEVLTLGKSAEDCATKPFCVWLGI